MKNWEYYEDEIKELVDSVGFNEIAVSKETRKPCKCNSIADCDNCVFTDGSETCAVLLIKWLYEKKTRFYQNNSFRI